MTSRLFRMRTFTALAVLTLVVVRVFPSDAQELPLDLVQEQTPPAAVEQPTEPQAPRRVEVEPQARDEDIEQRLTKILRATGWFTDPRVRTDEGVVFLSGHTGRDQYKEWAGKLAQNTRDVVAVVNQVTVETPSAWDFRPALEGIAALWRETLQALPFIAFGLVVLVLAWNAGSIAARLFQKMVRQRIVVPLLRSVIARAVGLLIFLLGLYLVLKVSGLTRLAMTVLGGTGLLGLVIGIAFRDITENFLASILLSIQRPFRTEDLVEVAGELGYVQQLNVRTTVLMTLTGNYVQIPNSTVYKSTIRNYTTNPYRREGFTIGIGYDVLIAEAQTVALDVLAKHPAVLADPEPWVLADSFGSAAVNLRIYFWLDGSTHSWLKVRSSVIRLVKRAFQDHGIRMPDDSRERVFPDGLSVRILREPPAPDRQATSSDAAECEPDALAVDAEAGLNSEAPQLQRQANRAALPAEGENLLQHYGGDGQGESGSR